MNSVKILFPAFILVAAVQLYVPSKMILDREDVLDTGTEFKFKTEPIDPSDPFRGKYITLRFEESRVKIQDEDDWVRGEPVYAIVTKDIDGFAKIKSLSKEEPTDDQEFFKATASYVTRDSAKELLIDYPFNRYYMEESKAYDAELTYRESARDTSRTTYALVNIKNGNAVLRDVMIDGISIKEIVRNRNQE